MKKTIIALMALAGVASAVTIQEDTTMAPGGNYYAGAFDFTFVLDEVLPTSTQYLLGYYANPAASGNYSANVFTLDYNAQNGLTLRLDRVASVTVTDGDISAVGNIHNSSTFAGTSGAYILGAGTYTVEYLGGGNGSAAADLYLDGTKVASFTGGSHNMNGGGDGTATLNVKVSDAYVVPEPTTATLSLLALAGLAARRRRK
ncbi:MAG: PEP-CTERM sorting domain-containing protein [Akkermansia sp.]|nr:PEP-CTERM sorting domain-containing protein [Akkermansia sp.]